LHQPSVTQSKLDNPKNTFIEEPKFVAMGSTNAKAKAQVVLTENSWLKRTALEVPDPDDNQLVLSLQRFDVKTETEVREPFSVHEIKEIWNEQVMFVKTRCSGVMSYRIAEVVHTQKYLIETLVLAVEEGLLEVVSAPTSTALNNAPLDNVT
jgi:hypothetical protein